MMFLAKRETRDGARGHVYALVYPYREILDHLSTSVDVPRCTGGFAVYYCASRLLYAW
jgi:hypothetical protein